MDKGADGGRGILSPGRGTVAGPGAVLVLDALAEDRFHLPRDDRFLVRALADGTHPVRVASSPESLHAIEAENPPGVVLSPLPLHGAWARTRVPPHLRHVVRTLRASGVREAKAVIFQSFSEPAVALFSRLHPRARLVLLVTNNLSGVDGQGWKSRLKRRLLVDAIGRARATVAFTSAHAARLRALAPAHADSVHVFRYYQAGIPRAIQPRAVRGGQINYVGWSRPDKGLDRFLSLVEADVDGRHAFGLFGLAALSAEQRARVSRLGNRLQVVNRYLSEAEYWNAIAGAAFVVLPYDAGYAGTLSGVYCDAIAAGTPVLCSAIEPFTEYAARYGAMGRIASLDDTAAWRAMLAPVSEAEWEAWQASMARAREDHAAERIGAAYRDLLRAVGS